MAPEGYQGDLNGNILEGIRISWRGILIRGGIWIYENRGEEESIPLPPI